jgi:hypothetical protein
MRILVASWLALALLVGCGGPPVELVKVQGTVKFADGSVPQGEVATVQFEPLPDGSQKIRKAASGPIKPDGSYELMTIQPGDGAIPGRYKVVFSVLKTYMGREPMVPAKYMDPATTPCEATVEPGKPNQFDFKLDKS